MTTQLRLVAVGYLSPSRDEIICDDAFLDTWTGGLLNSMDAPRTPRVLTDAESTAELEALRDGMEDDQWHSRGMW